MSAKKKLLILLTNDDGIEAQGLKALASQIKSLGDLFIIAPDREQSASSHSLTLTRPLRIKKYADNKFAVDGTPTDAVMIGVHGILKHKRLPDLLISGINHGPNMGDDVIYSGTVAAAIEGSLMGIPSMAVSLADWKTDDYLPAARAVKKIARWVIKRSLPQFSILNINIPYLGNKPYKGLRVTSLGHRVYKDVIHEKIDPRGRNYYWIAGQPDWSDVNGSDHAAVEQGMISISPLKTDMTDAKLHEELQDIKIKL